MSGSLAVVPVRAGVLPLGADEVVAEAGGVCLLIGSGCREAAPGLGGIASALWSIETGTYSAHRWAETAALVLAGQGQTDDGDPVEVPSTGHVLVPASPDGRDLGPHLALALDRAFIPAVLHIDDTTAEVTRYGGRVIDTLSLPQPVVASMQPGVRGVEPTTDGDGVEVTAVAVASAKEHAAAEPQRVEPRLIEELPADPSTMDLAEADRIVGGGAGLGSTEACQRMIELAAALGASPGGTRVITDWGWLPVERQIGTTGVIVDPSLYLSIGVSGAVQHTAGLGAPDHIISVNTDPHCPMMAMADLAIVCDGPDFLDQLIAKLRP